MSTGILGRIIRLTSQILIPVAIFLTALRALLTPVYVHSAYRVPGFPSDPYGFTLQDRLRWSQISLEYLLNDAGIEFLADLEFEDGGAVFNARELRHMQDVKSLTQTVLGVWMGALVALGLLVVSGYLLGHEALLWQGAARGVKWTILGVAGLTLLLLLSFPFVFVGFHRVFFEGDTWLFAYSDTLIRLFPERFWQQVFGALVSITLALCGFLYLLARTRLNVGDGPKPRTSPDASHGP